ncbi:MAG: hypothetical protein H6735_33680 [Alphaproteobacteria bacterium]|nr:hypothetical protein [Alphaproteobacteria bacterium]
MPNIILLLWWCHLLACGHARAPVVPEASFSPTPTSHVEVENTEVEDTDEHGEILLYRLPPQVWLVFDERWDWPAGAYDISIDGLIDREMRATTAVVCQATVGAPGLRAGDYVIDLPPVSGHGGSVSCDGSIRGEWALVPEVAGGLRIIGCWAMPGTEVRVTVLDSQGAIVHQGRGEPVDNVFVFMMDGVPPRLQSIADDLAAEYRRMLEIPPREPEPGPVDEWGLPLE